MGICVISSVGYEFPCTQTQHPPYTLTYIQKQQLGSWEEMQCIRTAARTSAVYNFRGRLLVLRGTRVHPSSVANEPSCVTDVRRASAVYTSSFWLILIPRNTANIHSFLSRFIYSIGYS